jgi:hypothetical protein
MRFTTDGRFAPNLISVPSADKVIYMTMLVLQTYRKGKVLASWEHWNLTGDFVDAAYWRQLNILSAPLEAMHRRCRFNSL